MVWYAGRAADEADHPQSRQEARASRPCSAWARRQGPERHRGGKQGQEPVHPLGLRGYAQERRQPSQQRQRQAVDHAQARQTDRQ